VLVTYGTNEDKKIGFAIHSVIGHQEILIKSLDKAFSKNKGFSGSTILGDGRVVPVLDLGDVINQRIH
jgi:two-component system chemotaxis sensor kinase CheA